MTRQPPSALTNALVTFGVFIVGQILICALLGSSGGGGVMAGALPFLAGTVVGIALAVLMTRKVAQGAVADSFRKAVAQWLIGAELKGKRQPASRHRKVANDNRKSRKAESRRNQMEVPRKRGA